MIHFRNAIRIGALLAVLAGVISIGWASSYGFSQGPDTPAKKAPAAKGEGAAQSDNTSCVTCHNNPSEHPFALRFNSDKYILLDEGQTWKRKDPHSRAHAVLSDKLAISMQERLKYKVAEAPACLACHATDTAPKNEMKNKKFENVETGVSCAACHGLNNTWQVEHFRVEDGKIPWRNLNPAEKLARLPKSDRFDPDHGFLDLRNPVKKAALCVSCHVGSAAEGKVISHEMYAAGHPPLPPFELATYLLGEPQHWMHQTDLPYFKAAQWVPSWAANWKYDERWQRFHFHPVEEESSAARNYAAGAVAALKAEAELIMHEAKIAIGKEDSVDFARFDCYACHHDLKPDSDRQKRGYKAAPGRPTLRASIVRSAELVAEHAIESKANGLSALAMKFADIWKELHSASTGRPYGEPAKMVEAARSAVGWCDKFLAILGDCATPIYSKSESKRLLIMIAKDVESKENPLIADPEVALVLSWAYSRVADDLKEALKQPKSAILHGIRREPFEQNAKPASPTRLDFKERSEWIKEFEGERFRKEFRGIIPSK